jgi:pimeloyl-ACP methyl ester carboxylesterase
MNSPNLGLGWRDSNVDAAGVHLAVRDFGGTGGAVVLLHGLGRTLVDWSVIGPLLARQFRAVAFDIRGHGKSGDGAWSWEQALFDIEAVAAHFVVGIPAVVGHSLGGMLAVMWAESHPGTPVVNIDGHGRRTARQYEGIPEDDARRRIAEAEERVKASLGALSGPLPRPMVEGLMAQQRALASRLGAPEEMFVEAIERSLRWEGGAAFLRPSPVGLGAEMLAKAESFDMFDLYRRVRAPVLVIAGTAPEPGADPELMAAYRRGLTRDLEQVPSTNPEVTVDFRSGGHGLLFEDPEGIADRIAAFLRPALS